MSGEASMKKIVTEEVRAILEIADRLYRLDKNRFRRILAWINAMNYRRVSNEIILRALRRLEEKVKAGEWRGEWWPYATATANKMREKIDAATLRRGGPSSVSEILAECLRRSRKFLKEDA